MVPSNSDGDLLETTELPELLKPHLFKQSTNQLLTSSVTKPLETSMFMLMIAEVQPVVLPNMPTFLLPLLQVLMSTSKFSLSTQLKLLALITT